MDPIFHKLQHRTGEETREAQEKNAIHEQTSETFHEVENLLRTDAARTGLPAAIEDRLRESLKSAPTARRSWWKRFFRR